MLTVYDCMLELHEALLCVNELVLRWNTPHKHRIAKTWQLK